MPVPTYTLSCLKNERIARDIYEFVLEKPAGFAFRGGQFVLFDFPLIDNRSDIQTRAFSIASAPHEKELLFVAKMNPGGRASRWIAEELKEGSTLVTKGPFGKFTLDENASDAILFIATSSGNAPFRSQILEALHRGDTRRMDFVFGVRGEEDLFWAEELSSIAKAHPNFFLHITLSQPSDAWTGHRGRVQTLVPQIVTDFSQRQVYVCGSPDMTKEMKKLALEEWGVGKEKLHVEGYI